MSNTSSKEIIYAIMHSHTQKDAENVLNRYVTSVCIEVIGDDELNYTQRPNLLKIDLSKARCGEDIDYAIKTNAELDNKWFDYEVAQHRYKLRAEQRQTLQTILNKRGK